MGALRRRRYVQPVRGTVATTAVLPHRPLPARSVSSHSCVSLIARQSLSLLLLLSLILLLLLRVRLGLLCPFSLDTTPPPSPASFTCTFPLHLPASALHADAHPPTPTSHAYRAVGHYTLFYHGLLIAAKRCAPPLWELWTLRLRSFEFHPYVRPLTLQATPPRLVSSCLPGPHPPQAPPARHAPFVGRPPPVRSLFRHSDQ